MDTGQGPLVGERHGGFPSGTTVALTGGTGFIGGRLAERLAQCGAETTCLIRGGNAGTRLHRAGASIRRLDLSDTEAVRAALVGMEVIFHLAYDSEDEAWNLAALRALIGACQSNGCRRLVHVSSFVVYDTPRNGAMDEDTPQAAAMDGYAHVKLSLERLLLTAVREDGVPATIVQPTIVYGPLCRPWTIDPADSLRHGTVILPDHGEGVCNAVYVDDVVSAMMLAAHRPEAIGQRYLVSGPVPITWRTFYEGMAQAAGAAGPRFLPAGDIVRANGRLGKVRRSIGDPALAVRRVAGIGPVQKLVTAVLKLVPGRMRRTLHTRLYAPSSRRPGHVHLPNPGQMTMLQGEATIPSTKARRELGYEPAWSFEQGLAQTARFLGERYAREPAGPDRANG